MPWCSGAIREWPRRLDTLLVTLAGCLTGGPSASLPLCSDTMDVGIINEGIREAKELLEAARAQQAEACFEHAMDSLRLAREAIGKAVKEFELAGVQVVDGILDIRWWINEEEFKTDARAAAAGGEAALQNAQRLLTGEDIEGAQKERRSAAALFAKGYSVLGELARELSNRNGSRTRMEEQQKKLSDELQLLQQGHTEKLAVLDRAIDAEAERQSFVSVGDAALAAARMKLTEGNVDDAKEERATAVYAFSQASANRKIELVWLNDQIVETEQQLRAQEGDKALAKSKVHVQRDEFEAARMSQSSAEKIYRSVNDSAKLALAIQFKDDISRAEMDDGLKQGDDVIVAARSKLSSSVCHAYQDEIESAHTAQAFNVIRFQLEHIQAMHGKAAGHYQHAEQVAQTMLREFDADIQQFQCRIETLRKEHAPCIALLQSISETRDDVQAEITELEEEIKEGQELRNSVSGRIELKRLQKRHAAAEKKMSEISGPLRAAEKEREAQKMVHMSVKGDLRVAEAAKKAIEDEFGRRQASLYDLDCDIKAADCLIDGCELLREFVNFDDCDILTEAVDKFAEGLEAAESEDMKAHLLYIRGGAFLKMGLKMGDSDDGSEASKYYTMALDDAAARQKIRPSSARSFEMEAQALQRLGRCQEAGEREQLSQSIALLKSSPGDPRIMEKVKMSFNKVCSEKYKPQEKTSVSRDDFQVKTVFEGSQVSRSHAPSLASFLFADANVGYVFFRMPQEGCWGLCRKCAQRHPRS